MAIYDPTLRTNAAIAQRLIATRRALGYSQAELCRRTGIAPNTYNQYEKARNRPDWENANRLCDGLGITLDWIFRGDPSSVSNKQAGVDRSNARVLTINHPCAMTAEDDTLGLRLKNLRMERGETQAIVSAATGISRSHLANIEGGRDTPGWGTAVALAAYFGCSLDWLASVADQIQPGSATVANENEALLLHLFRALPRDEADAILKLLFGRVRPNRY
jgi:transcriptional regulator with XRE-family HTH domain